MVRMIRKRWQQDVRYIHLLLDGASDGSANVWQQRLASCRVYRPTRRFRTGIGKKFRYVRKIVVFKVERESSGSVYRYAIR